MKVKNHFMTSVKLACYTNAYVTWYCNLYCYLWTYYSESEWRCKNSWVVTRCKSQVSHYCLKSPKSHFVGGESDDYHRYQQHRKQKRKLTGGSVGRQKGRGRKRSKRSSKRSSKWIAAGKEQSTLLYLQFSAWNPKNVVFNLLLNKWLAKHTNIQV